MKREKESSMLKQFYQKLKIRHKIVFAIYLVLFPTLIIGGGLIYSRTYQTTMEETTQLYQRFTQTACDDIAYLQQDVQDISTYFAVNTDIHNVLVAQKETLGEDTLFWETRTPVSFLQDILAIKSQIKTVILYPENGAEPFYISRDASVHNTNLEEIRNLPIYQTVDEARGDVVWLRQEAGRGGIYLNNKSDKIIACRALYDLSKRRRLGFLAIGMEASRYYDICHRTLNAPNEGIVVLDREGKELTRAGEVSELVLEHIRDSENAGPRSGDDGQGRYVRQEGYYIFCSQNENTGIEVCYMSPKSNWNDRIRQSLTMPVLLAFAILILTWTLSSVVSRALTKPIAALCQSMEKFKEGDFSQTMKTDSQDEIGQLSQTFNDMVLEIGNLINKNYVMALRERESELNALQAQINPHFLYNVLDSLYWQAIGSGNEELGEDVLALSKLFRLLLSQGQSEVNVSTEIELITCYLQIQKMRFAKRLSYEIHVDEDMMKCMIGKLTLQPFVENAIVHGLEVRQGGGTVSVSGCKESGKLVFEIRDNGVGMEQEEADKLLVIDEKTRYSSARIGRYAIRNIKERLTLKYNDNYTLEMHSEPGKGTLVRIVIPEEY